MLENGAEFVGFRNNKGMPEACMTFMDSSPKSVAVDVKPKESTNATTSDAFCSAEEGTLGGGPGAPGLYSPETDVVFRSEIIPDDKVLALLRAIYVAMFLGFVAVIVVFSLKVSGTMKTLRDTTPVLQVPVAFLYQCPVSDSLHGFH